MTRIFSILFQIGAFFILRVIIFQIPFIGGVKLNVYEGLRYCLHMRKLGYGLTLG